MISYQTDGVTYSYLRRCRSSAPCMKNVSRAVEQKTNLLGFPKPGKIIEMTGAHMLEASDRAIFNVLYQMAHDNGELLDPAAEWEIPLATLRQAFSKHESNKRLRDSVERLRTVRANINYLDDKGEPRVILTSLFDFSDIPARNMTTRPTLRFGLPRKMIPDQPICDRTLRASAASVWFGEVTRNHHHWPLPRTAQRAARQVRSCRQPDAQGDRGRCFAGEHPVRHGYDDPGEPEALTCTR
jgi:hypothetical protein